MDITDVIAIYGADIRVGKMPPKAVILDVHNHETGQVLTQVSINARQAQGLIDALTAALADLD